MMVETQCRGPQAVNLPPSPSPRVSQSARVRGEVWGHSYRPAHVRRKSWGDSRAKGQYGGSNPSKLKTKPSRSATRDGWEGGGLRRGSAVARGASPFRGWPPGVTRLVGPPCRYNYEVIILHQSVQTRNAPSRFCPPTSCPTRPCL